MRTVLVVLPYIFLDLSEAAEANKLEVVQALEVECRSSRGSSNARGQALEVECRNSRGNNNARGPTSDVQLFVLEVELSA